MPQPPKEPNYETIVKEELKKIGFSLSDKTYLSKVLSKSNTPKNLAYNEALIEAFIANTISRINSEYMQYINQLNDYENALIEYKTWLQNRKAENEALIAKEQAEFQILQTFYDNFQNLAKSKFQFVSKIIESKLKISEDSN